MWLRLWPLVYSGPDCRAGRRISISVIALRHGEEVWGGNTFLPGDNDFFFPFLYFPDFFFLFSLRFDPVATTLLRSYQWHKRATRLRGNNLNREAGSRQRQPVACVSRLTGPHPFRADAGGGGRCLFCRWWIEEGEEEEEGDFFFGGGVISSPSRTAPGTVLLHFFFLKSTLGRDWKL